MTTPLVTHQPLPLQRFTQETDSHCGPATLQMLYSHLGINVSQAQIVEAAGITDRIKDCGSRPIELAKAVSVLTPNYQFVFKNRAARSDLAKLILDHEYPVGISWQGLYYDSPEEERASEFERLPGNNGHYSVVVGIDEAKDLIQIMDPYYEFTDTVRTLSLSWFESRWWDRVQDLDKKSGEILFTATNQLLFVIVPNEKVPKGIELRPSSEISSLSF